MASIAIGSIIKSGNRIKIRANLGGQLANILIDSGAACSCIDIPLPLTNETIPIQGIGDTIMIATKTQPVQLDLGVTVLEESLWYLPNNSEGTVLGMDIMRKYGFVIHCFEKQIELKTEKTVKQCLPKKITSVMSISTPDPIQQMVNKHDSIWATHEHDCGLIDFVVCIEGEPPPPQKQYRIKPEAESAVHEIVHQQKPVIKLYHDYAHVSAPKTQQLIQKNFWWPQMASDIQRWCDTCIVCATINQGKPGRTKLCRPEPPKGPWELLQLDFIGPLPSAKGGYRYCLVIIDKFSKWVEAIPTRNNSANTVARVVANQILPLWGAPIQIESDQGTHFTGQVMKQICQMLNIKQRFHIPYRPQSSGMVERANRTIKESISKQVAQHKNQWIDALPTVLTILRATPSKATGISPFELMTGRVMKLPIDPEIAPADLGPLVVATQQSVLKQLRERLEVLHAHAALKQQQSDLTNDTQFNPTSEVKFSEGDMVMVRVFVKQGAFTPRWHGPYEVKAICNSCVATTVKGKLRWYHMSQCKSYKSTQNK